MTYATIIFATIGCLLLPYILRRAPGISRLDAYPAWPLYFYSPLKPRRIELAITIAVAALVAIKLSREPIYRIDQTAETIRLISSLITVYLIAIIAYVDLKIGLIPDHLIYPAMIFAAIAIPEHDLTKQAMNAAILAAGIKIIRDTIYICTQQHLIGGGDIKLAIILGLILTPKDIGYTAAAAALIAIFISIAARKSKSDFMRYGPLVAAPALMLSIFPT